MKLTSDQSDEWLFHSYVSTGEKRWLSILFDRYRLMVFGVCCKYLKEPEQANDATMDLFEKLLSQPQKSEVKHFKVWLFVLTKNHCLMILRKKSPQFTNVEDTFVESDSIWHPMEEGEEEARQARLDECLKRLPAGQLSCIRGFFYDKLPYQELARRLSMEVKKVKSNIQNGKRNLKLCMERHHE